MPWRRVLTDTPQPSDAPVLPMNSAKTTEETEQPLPLPKRKWRPGAVTYIIVTFALAGGLCWAGVWLWTRSARSAFVAELNAIESRGEALRFADYRPDDPSAYPGTEDYRRALRDLSAYLGDQDNATAQEFMVMTGRLQTPGITVIANYTDADLKNIRLMREELTEAHAALSAALDQDIALDLDYETYTGVTDQQLSGGTLRNWFRVLMADGYLAISDGDADRAIVVIEDILKLSAPRTNVSLVVNKFTDMNMGRGGVELTVSLIEHVTLTDAQRARLDQRIAETESRFRFAPAVLADRATLYELVGGWDVWIDGSQSDDLEMLDVDRFDAWLYANFQAVRYNDLTTLLQMTSRGAGFIDQTGPQGHAATERFEQDMASLPDRAVVARAFVNDMTTLRDAGLRYRQELRGLRLALRVDASFRKNGQLPTLLREVLDADLPEVPSCTFSGKSPGFRVTEAGFVIYGLGPDGNDEGVPVPDTRYGVIEMDYPAPIGQ